MNYDHAPDSFVRAFNIKMRAWCQEQDFETNMAEPVECILLNDWYFKQDNCEEQSFSLYFHNGNKPDFREKFYKTKDKHYLINPFKSNNFIEENEKKITKINSESIKEKVQFITIGSSITYEDNENTIEQEYHISLLKNIFNAVKIQKKGGSLVIKVFETYTDVTAKIISILISLYDKVFFIKPMTSKPSQSEKYIVCNGFKLSDVTGIVKKLEKIIDTIEKNPKLKLCDLFSDYEIDFKLKIRLIKLNQLVSNMVFKSMGEIVNFINSQDYYGDTYETYREKQIEANNFWVETFFPDPKDFKEVKKKIVDASFLTNKMNVDDSIYLEKKLSL